jgi:alpha-tubulin suppressor-like RCC1 family protein
VLGGTGLASAAPYARATATIVSLKVSPSPVSSNGGKITVTAKVRSARTCTFSITPKVKGFPVTRGCSSGSASATLKIAPNNSIATKHFTIKVTVQGSGRAASATTKLAQPPRTLTGVKTVVGQGESYCALLLSGRVDCWGFNEFGQLGDGKTKNSGRPVAVTGLGGKGLLTGVAAVMDGPLGLGDSFCAVLKSGGVDCWGYNLNGQLGDGSTANSDKPVAVKGVGGAGLLTGATQLQPDTYGFCAALKSGLVDCWGLNEDGDLGSGSFNGPDTCGAIDNPCSTTPVGVVGTSGTGTLGSVATLVGEGSSMCVILTSQKANCWGYNGNDQLGDGTTADSPMPMTVVGLGGTGTLTGITSLTGDQDNGTSICARLASGRVDCWGEDTWGELGNGVTGIFNDSPFPVSVKGVGGKGTLSGAASLIGVPGLTNCAILTSRVVDCWGYDGDLALGDPHVTGFESNVPVRVVGTSGKGSLAGVASLVAGDGSGGGDVCAVLTSGGVDCWGSTSSGFSTSPTRVPGLGGIKPPTKVRSLASDEDGSNCAVLVTGGVKCWGLDSSGELGNGTIVGSNVPEPVLAAA